MTWFEAIIIAIVEGVTEYLPISSTAHMVFATALLGVEETDYMKMFTISIQLGAILSVVAAYRRKFFDRNNLFFYVKLCAAVMPALVLGLLFDSKIEAVLGNPTAIAAALIVGGVALLFVDRFFRNPSVASERDVSVKKAVAIGFWQCMAMMPGVSRSAASIIGGMQQGLTRKAAAEFSFFLAVPTMAAATCYSVFLKNWSLNGAPAKGYELIFQDGRSLTAFVLGSVIAFATAMAVIKAFIGLIERYGFRPWGWYRIAAGAALLAIFLTGAR